MKKKKLMLSRTRLAYTVGVVVVSAILGIAAPVFATSLSGVNSHSAQIGSFPGTPGYQDHIGPGTLTFWTNNVTLASHIPPPGNSITGTMAVTIVNGTTYHYNCYGPNIIERVPVGSAPHFTGGNMSFTTPPEPGYVLVVIDLSQYCKLVSVTNG